MIGWPHCAPIDGKSVGIVESEVKKGPFLSGRVVRVNDTSQEKARLVLETPNGFALTNVVLWARYHDDPGCGHASAERLESADLVTGNLGRDYLVVRLVLTDIYWQMPPDPGGTKKVAYAMRHRRPRRRELPRAANRRPGSRLARWMGRQCRNVPDRRPKEREVGFPQGADPGPRWRPTPRPLARRRLALWATARLATADDKARVESKDGPNASHAVRCRCRVWGVLGVPSLFGIRPGRCGF